MSDSDKAWFNYFEELDWKRFDYVNEADKQLTAKFAVLLAAVVALASQSSAEASTDSRSALLLSDLILFLGLVMAAVAALFGFNAGVSAPGPNAKSIRERYEKYGLVKESRQSVAIGLQRAITKNEKRQALRAVYFNFSLFSVMTALLLSCSVKLFSKLEPTITTALRGYCKMNCQSADTDWQPAQQPVSTMNSCLHHCNGTTHQNPPPADPGPKEEVKKSGSKR